MLALVTAAPSLRAQQAKVRLAGVRTQYANAVSGTAGTVTSQIRWGGSWFQAGLDGNFSQFTSGPWAVQGSGNLLGIRYVGSSIGLGLRAVGDAGYLSDRIWSGTALVGPVAAFASGGWVLSAGLSAGGVRRVDHQSLLDLTGSALVHRELGRWTLEAGGAATRAGPVRFADASVGVDVSVSTLTLAAVAGARTGDLGTPPWYQGRAELELTPALSLEVSGGSYPRDLTGFTGGSFLSIGFWVALGPRARLASPDEIVRRFASQTSGVKVESEEPGHQQVTFRVPGARTVAIAGEWNDWTPVVLARVDGERWRADLALSQGTHRFSLVVDGTKWMVPQGVVTLPDDMGGKVGLLIVEQ